MFLLEWLMGLVVGWWAVRFGLVSIFSLLLILPFLPWSIHAWGVIGLTSAVIGSPSLLPFRSLTWLVGLAGGFAGVFIFESIQSSLPSLDGVVFLAIVGVLTCIFFFSPYPKWKLVLGVFFSFVLGYFVLVRWVVPAGVASILLGLSGFRFLEMNTTADHSWMTSARDSFVGVLAGLIPGIGPGLLGLVGNHFSPALGIANLVFSMGLVSLSTSVRSAPAAALAYHSIPIWSEVMFALILGVFVVGFFHALFPPHSNTHPFFQTSITFLILAWAGGWLSIGSALLARGIERLFSSYGIPSELGLLFLIPPIWLFYS